MGASIPPERSTGAASNTFARARRHAGRLTESPRRASLRTAVFCSLAVVLVIVAAVFALLAHANDIALNDAARTSHSDEVLESANADERMVIDLETGLRGYLLTDQRRFLEPYSQARVSLNEQLPQLETLVKNDPAQLLRAEAIKAAVSSYERSYLAPLVSSDRPLTEGQKVASTQEGKLLVDAMRRRFTSFAGKQETLSRERRRGATASAHKARALAIGGFALVALLLLLLAAYLTRAMLTPIRHVAGAAARLRDGEHSTRVAQAGRGEVGALGVAFNSMAQTLEERELTLRITNERFQGVLDNANAAIYIKDTDSRYLLVNREFERIRSMKAEEILGHNGNELGSAETGDQVRASDRAVIDGGIAMSFEQEVRSPDGDRTYLAVKFPIQETDGVVTAVAGISTDITEQKRALAEAVEASRHKSEFVANMSHELRTPLNGVVGMTTLLAATSLDSVQREYADALASSSAALLSIINDILDFAKIEVGHLELDPTNFELRTAIAEACLTPAEQARAKGLQISHWVDAEVPITVNGDRGRLRQILLNLLANAVKFTATGGVEVRVSNAGGDAVRFEVSDTGVGVDEDQAPHLFDAFVQADQSTTRRYGGTGLGLAISRELANRMGGDIGAEPRDGGGSMFWFTAVLPAVANAEQPVRARPELVGQRALIVDDDPTRRATFEHHLRAWGLVCESVEQPSAAMEALERASRDGKPFQLALVDFDMGHGDGTELVRAIRHRPLLRGLQIVALSSSPPDRDVSAGAELSAFLTKPVRQSRLHAAIAEAVSGPVVPPAQIRAQAPTDVALDAPLVLIAEDNEINHAVAKALLVRHGLRTAVAHNGREAVAMALANTYAAILMDCQMPELDGYEATRRIRAAEGSAHVPIIAMTAHSMPGDRERCINAGMDDYISKPVRAELLNAAMDHWLGGPAPGNELADAGNGGPADVEDGAIAEDSVLDWATVSQLREALTLEMRETLMEAFESSLPECVADIAAAARRGDEIELRRVAHLLKGSAATLGAEHLRLCCQALEHATRAQDLDAGGAQLDDLEAIATEAREALRRELLGS
jgi:two-component system, sensor histidine kinase and response regulator